MFIYDESKSVYDNLHLLVNEYNRLCSIIQNNHIIYNELLKQLKNTEENNNGSTET